MCHIHTYECIYIYIYIHKYHITHMWCIHRHIRDKISTQKCTTIQCIKTYLEAIHYRTILLVPFVYFPGFIHIRHRITTREQKPSDTCKITINSLIRRHKQNARNLVHTQAFYIPFSNVSSVWIVKLSRITVSEEVGNHNFEFNDVACILYLTILTCKRGTGVYPPTVVS